MAKAAGARCPVAKATDRFRRQARAELARKRMRVSEIEFAGLLANYGRVAHRLAASGDEIRGDWPARVAILAEVVLDARNRVEMKALSDGK